HAGPPGVADAEDANAPVASASAILALIFLGPPVTGCLRTTRIHAGRIFVAFNIAFLLLGLDTAGVVSPSIRAPERTPPAPRVRQLAVDGSVRACGSFRRRASRSPPLVAARISPSAPAAPMLASL